MAAEKEYEVDVKMDGSGILTLTNKTEYDLRIFYRDEDDKSCNLLCFSKSTRVYEDRQYLYITYKKDNVEEKMERSESRTFSGICVRNETRRKDIKNENITETDWADDDDNFPEKKIINVHQPDSVEKLILQLQTACVRAGLNVQYRITRGSHILYTNVSLKR